MRLFSCHVILLFLRSGVSIDTVIVNRADRLDNLIMEAITTLKEPGGSNKTTIATYIEVVLYLFYEYR